MCVQAHVISTSRRATVVVVALSLGALTFSVIGRNVWNFHIRSFRLITHINSIVFLVLLPVTVFIVNMIVLCQVRRASNSAAVNLGLQQHHQSTSSNSAVPTVTLVTTSLVYVFLITPGAIVLVFLDVIPYSVWCYETWISSLHVAEQFIWVALGLYHVVFAYNFFVYVITWKQFRCELRQLCCRASSSSTNTEH